MLNIGLTWFLMICISFFYNTSYIALRLTDFSEPAGREKSVILSVELDFIGIGFLFEPKEAFLQ